jgi:ribosomal protein S18 acetylase RimI-like enzyme
VRAYRAADFESVCAIDAACFDDFWRYDRELLARYLECERSTVVETDGAVAGFAFCSLRGSDGVLGRVAVAPEWRGSGIGLALTHDATVHLLDSGARSVNLCTQADNERSRRLYVRLGYVEGAERLLMLVSSTH